MPGDAGCRLHGQYSIGRNAFPLRNGRRLNSDNTSQGDHAAGFIDCLLQCWVAHKSNISVAYLHVNNTYADRSVSMAYFEDMSIGKKIRTARKAGKLTQRELGERLNVSAAAVTQWESGSTTPELDRLPAIEDALGLQRGALVYDDEDRRDVPTQMPFLEEPRINLDEGRPIRPGVTKDLPIYAAVRGSYEGTYIDMTQYIEFQERPPYLDGVKQAFGILVISDSMEPRYHPHEIIYVHPGRPVRARDYVVVELPNRQGIVKRLVKMSDDYIELEQFNPPEIRRLKRSDVVAIYLIMGSGPGK